MNRRRRWSGDPGGSRSEGHSCQLESGRRAWGRAHPPKHNAVESCFGFEASRSRQGLLSPASITFQYVLLSNVFNFCKSCCLIYKKGRLFLILQDCVKFQEIMCTIHKGPNTDQALKRKLLCILKELFTMSRKFS